jgi:hypothetical protein
MALKGAHQVTAAVMALGLLRAQGVAERQATPTTHLRQVRFSPDGKYVLAQDDSEVAVLTVQPFAVLFRIPANTAGAAQFTPDSQELVLLSSIARARPGTIALNPSARVERWRIADRASVDSTPAPKLACGTEVLSPDGRVLACDDFGGTLRLIDITSGQTIFERKQFVKYRGNLGSARLAFSSDGRFLVALPSGGSGRIVAWDTREKTAVNMPGAPKWTEGSSMVCAFVAPDRLMISFGRGNKDRLVTAMLVEFPSGQVLMKPKLPPGALFRAADPNFVLVRAFGRRPRNATDVRAAAVEFAAGRVIVSNTPALDVFGTHYVTERRTGEIGLYDRSKGLQAAVMIARKLPVR